MSLPANINISQARLPATYEQAKAALSNCARIDECKDWADKAAALASYAKQADDDEMMKMAVRVRDRAIRRAGELLKQVEPQPGKRTDVEPSGGAPTRLKAARDAGMSRDQMHTALRVANVPEADFERQVESRNPPTVSKLAEQGKKAAPRPAIDLKGRDPAEFNRAMHYVGEWESVARTLTGLGHDAALPILNPSEAARLRAAIASIDAITDRIITRI
jgi:hypothetical protein